MVISYLPNILLMSSNSCIFKNQFFFSKGKFTKKNPNKTKEQANKSNSQTEETTKPVLKKTPNKTEN